MANFSGNINKNIFKVVTIIVVIIVFFPLVTQAADADSVSSFERGILEQVEYTSEGADISWGSADLSTVIGNIIKAFLGFLGVVALILVIYGGWTWMTAGGNEEQITKSKKILKNAVIGLIIITLAYAITSFVVSTLQSSV